jgi:hypothetical protein
MTRARAYGAQRPTLVQVYIDAGAARRAGQEFPAVHDEFARRWHEWHDSVCGRANCKQHVDERLVEWGMA